MDSNLLSPGGIAQMTSAIFFVSTTSGSCRWKSKSSSNISNLSVSETSSQPSPAGAKWKRAKKRGIWRGEGQKVQT